MADVTSPSIPIVDYLVLDDGDAHLVGQRCDSCAATYLERRNACSACGGRTFSAARLVDRGLVESFTIVHRGAPKDSGPFVSAVVKLDDGAYVKANLIDVAPEPGAVSHTEPVRLRTFVAATGDDGSEAIGFGFAYEGDA